MVVLSLTLGVAIFVSSFESVLAAESAIARTANATQSTAEWTVSYGNFVGIPEKVADELGAIKGSETVPILEASAVTETQHARNFLIYGVDPQRASHQNHLSQVSVADFGAIASLAETPDGILLTQKFAASESVRAGGLLSLDTGKGLRKFRVAGLISDPRASHLASGAFGIALLSTAQRLVGQPGLVDRIEVSGVSRAQIQNICPTCQIERPGKLGSAAQDALGRIRSLLGVSVLALLVGLLLIYNTVQVSVLDRMKDIAILRAVGATRFQILFLLLSEWLAVGAASSVFGILLGSGMAGLLVEYTRRTVNTMVPLMADAKVEVTPVLIGVSMIIGVGTALAAALVPVAAAARVRPLEILRPYAYRRARSFVPAAVVGFLLFCLGNYGITNLHASIEWGLVMVAVEFLSVALIFPQIVIWLGRILRKQMVSRASFGPFLALDGLLKAPHRTAFTIMTFGCSLMMTVATESLVDGFRKSTGTWMSVAFPFDISVMGNDISASVYGTQVLPQKLTPELAKVPGISGAYSVRKLFTSFRGQDVMAIGVDLEPYLLARREKNMKMWPTELADPEALRSFREGTGVFLSDNFSELFQIQPGESIQMQTPSGPKTFRVLGKTDDYSWPHGAFIIGLKELQTSWKDDVISYVDLVVAPGQSLAEVKTRVQHAAKKNQMAFAFDRQEIRDVTDSVLEQTVSMANIQAIIAILIGVLGVINAIWIGVVNRQREIGLWRAIGVTRRQVVRIVLSEGIYIGFAAALIGDVGGLYGGWVPLRSFSYDITGYRYPLVVPWPQVGMVVFLAFGLGIAAGIFPARMAGKTPVLEAIACE